MCGPVVLRVLVGVVAAVPGGELLVPQPGLAPQPVALLELRRRVDPPLKTNIKRTWCHCQKMNLRRGVKLKLILFVTSVEKSLKLWRSFKQHIKIHQINSVSCDVCPKSFTSKKYMSKHIKNVHQSKTFSCDECEKTFSTSWNMTNHRKSAHENEFKICSICEKPVGMTSSSQVAITGKILSQIPLVKCNLGGVLHFNSYNI